MASPIPDFLPKNSSSLAKVALICLKRLRCRRGKTL
jgi:hypothetical protein